MKRLSLLLLVNTILTSPSFSQRKPLAAVILYQDCRSLDLPANGEVGPLMGAGTCIGYVTAVLDLTPGQSLTPDEAAHAFVTFFENQFGDKAGFRLHVEPPQTINHAIEELCKDRGFKAPCDSIFDEPATTVLHRAMIALQKRASS